MVYQVSDCPLRGFPSPLILCPAKPEPQWRLKTNERTIRERTKNMFTNKVQTSSPGRVSVKSILAAAARVASPKPTRQQATPPSDVDIATKAYEIWLSRGQESGNDQQHWFEAQLQLQSILVSPQPGAEKARMDADKPDRSGRMRFIASLAMRNWGGRFLKRVNTGHHTSDLPGRGWIHQVRMG
jgi:hypothetical protein